MFALCGRMMANHADALDATQEAMIAVVRGLPRFDRRSTFSTWVYRVTTNACLDELRRRSRRPVVALHDDQAAQIPAPNDAADPVEAVADRLDIDEALARLPFDFRVAVVLRDQCRLDYAEIAEVLGIPPGTVRSRIARGRAALCEFLAPGNHDALPQRPSEHP